MQFSHSGLEIIYNLILIDREFHAELCRIVSLAKRQAQKAADPVAAVIEQIVYQMRSCFKTWDQGGTDDLHWKLAQIAVGPLAEIDGLEEIALILLCQPSTRIAA
jgi:hypothetical protein